MLAAALALATPVAERVLLGLGGYDLFGARNLNTSSPGFALSIGAIATGDRGAGGDPVATVVLGVFAFSTVRSLDPNVSTIKFKSAAAFIDGRAGADDVVIDLISPAVSPVPLTPLDVYLPRTAPPSTALYLPDGPPPFLDFPPPPGAAPREALRRGRRPPPLSRRR